MSRVDELPVNEEQKDGCLLTVKENGDRKLSFNCKLVVEFSNKSTQVSIESILDMEMLLYCIL